MWMKILGSALVTVSCSGLGMWKAEQWKEHRKMLEQIRKMILLQKFLCKHCFSCVGCSRD